MTSSYNTILGTDTADSLVGTSGADSISAVQGNDTIDGKGGADLLFGGAENDLIYAGVATNAATFSGQQGNDTLSLGSVTAIAPPSTAVLVMTRSSRRYLHYRCIPLW